MTPRGFRRFVAYSTKLAIVCHFGSERRLAIDSTVDVPVAREARVVEHDLVEAGSGGCHRDVDVVLPDPLVVRVRPPEPGAVAPHRAVSRTNRHPGTSLGQPWILEHDDAPDQVHAGGVRLPRDRGRVVVALRAADLCRERHSARAEADLAVLVLDVELERVQALLAQLEVLLELPGHRGERGGDVDAAGLLRSLERRRRSNLCLGLRLRGGAGLAAAGVAAREELRVQCERHDRADEHGENREGADLAPPPCAPSALSETVARIDPSREDWRIVEHEEQERYARGAVFASACG